MTIENFKNLSGALSDIFTVLGIIIAGFWTLYNFGITRAGAPQIKIDLNLKSVIPTSSGRIAILTLIVTNTGKTKVKKRLAIIEVSNVDVTGHLGQLIRVTNPLEYKNNIHKVLSSHDYLEPSEIYHEEISFTVTDIQLLQSGVVFIGEKKHQTWEANYIFDLSLTEENKKSLGNDV